MLKVLAAAILIAIAFISPAAKAQAQPLNVVVMMTDDQRWDTLEVMERTRALVGGHGVTFANAESSRTSLRLQMLRFARKSNGNKCLGRNITVAPCFPPVA